MRKLSKTRLEGTAYVQVLGIKRKIPLGGTSGIYWDTKINVVGKTYINRDDVGYDCLRFPTLAELEKQGKCWSGNLLRTHDISFSEDKDELTLEEIKSIVKEFCLHGFRVSRKAILHNYYAWKNHRKSGYRGSGYHLFTPCGHKPLSFCVSSLSRKCQSWQITYEY